MWRITQQLGFNGIFLNVQHLNCHKNITGVQEVSSSVHLSDSEFVRIDSLSVFLVFALSICLPVSLPLLTGLFAVSDTRLWPSYLFR